MKPHIIIIALAIATVASAETLSLKDGTTVTGEISRADAAAVTLITSDGIRRISTDDIAEASRAAVAGAIKPAAPDELAKLREENARLRAEVASLRARLASGFQSSAPAPSAPVGKYEGETPHQKNAKAEMIEKTLIPRVKAEILQIEDRIAQAKERRDKPAALRRADELKAAKAALSDLQAELSTLRRP
jgi:hypothetical protein